MVIEYYKVALALVLITIIAFALVGVSYVAILKQYEQEKFSAYECGFDPFEDTRSRFEVRFYLVAILFIIFDLEITFLFPWSLALSLIDIFGYLSMIFFLFVLILGFLYEWIKGALDWE